MVNSKLLQRLSPAPVLGVSMANITLLRLDRSGGLAPGNKSFKLKANLAYAREYRLARLVSFGGAWSNHLHALAAAGRESGFETVGIVRGEPSATPSATLLDARDWGMQLEHVSREQYRRRHDPDYLATLRQRYGPCLIIPEGGANPAGVRGCEAIAELLPESGSRIVLPVGTGTTLAGLAAKLDARRSIVGISVLKGARDLDQRVSAAVEGVGSNIRAQWEILHDHHCGGYARVTPELKAFILEFEGIHKIPLDPVYTGKALFAVYQMLKCGSWTGEITFIHTGGLQGRRGFPWLS